MYMRNRRRRLNRNYYAPTNDYNSWPYITMPALQTAALIVYDRLILHLATRCWPIPLQQGQHLPVSLKNWKRKDLLLSRPKMVCSAFIAGILERNISLMLFINTG